MDREIINRFNKSAKEKRETLFMFLMEVFGMLNLSSSIMQYPSIVNNIQSAFCFSTVLVLSYLGYNNEKSKYLIEKLKKDNEDLYEDVKRNYDMYMASLARITSAFKFDSVLELCIFLDLLMSEGYFSITDKLEYKIFEENMDIYTDLLGTTVITGQSVCRHNTSFMNDLLTKLNIKNFKLFTYLMGNKKKLIRHDFSDHLILGLVENNKVFGYDFTHHALVEVEDEDTLKFVSVEPIDHDTYLSIVNKNNIGEYLKLEPLSLSEEELKITCIKAYTKFQFYKEVYGVFKNQSMDTMEDIASKNLVLMPRK